MNYYINTKLMELFLTFSEQQEADNTDGVNLFMLKNRQILNMTRITC